MAEGSPEDVDVNSFVLSTVRRVSFLFDFLKNEIVRFDLHLAVVL